MELLVQFLKIREEPISNFGTPGVYHTYIEPLLDRYWYKLSRHQKNKSVLYWSLIATAVYILSPSIFPPSQKMLSSKARPDKYTTGLINMDIDCFANSTLQSLAALPGLNEYLNELCNAVYNDAEIRSKFVPPELPLHGALIGILSNLQKVIHKSKTISVWDFLNVLEKIFKSKISRNQHDAHELLQLILETLFQENLALYKYALRSGMLETVKVPPLPVRSLLLNQLQCTVCGGKSSLNSNPMMILTLPVPQKSSVELRDLISENEKELIEGYSCLRCKINAIINLETQKRTLNDSDLLKLRKLQADDALMINDDLPPELDSIITTYKPSNGFQIDSVRTTINKRNDIIKAPKILPIHLSRSIFTNTQELRNSCQVLFPEELILTTDETLASQLQDIEEKKILTHFELQDSQPPKNEEEFLKPSILKDVDEKQEDAFYEDVGQNSDIDDDNPDSAGEEEIDSADEDQDDDGAASSPPSPIFKKGFEESPPSSTTASDSMNYKTPAPKSEKNTPVTESLDPLAAAAAPSDPSTTKLIKHTYKLKSVIRHVGTHQAGHYECYRHKPDFFKIDSDEFEIQFPFLINGVGNNDDDEQSQGGSETAVSDSTDAEAPKSAVSRSSSMNRSRSFSMSQASKSDSTTTRTSRSGSIQIDESQNSATMSRTSSKRKSSRFSRRLSSFLSPTTNNVDSLTSATGDLTLSAAPKKKKKLSSYVKYPFWRISDSKITEAKVDDVLNDNQAVYMLFYERVD